ncbi:MAG TPA: fibrobacter succinogenes major paralogous domain-containing protein [bacterium]|nr:fibrobacter succinogenes major paralogous domain-containing protein [bacterium]
MNLTRCIKRMMIAVCGLLIISGCGDKKSPTESKNTAPTALFVVLPMMGSLDTDFQADASKSNDSEDPGSALQVRWDWENDGVWDTDYQAAKSASHRYTTLGAKTIKLEVKDSGDLLSTAVNTILVAEMGTLADVDGNSYKTIKIGNQWWMAENLKATHYRNGDAVPQVTDNAAWTALNTGAYCNYENDASNATTYGRLYNWYAATDVRKLAPLGWHVPTDAEWKTLETALGMSPADIEGTWGRGDGIGGKMKETSATHWAGPNEGATNASGFTALPAGSRRNTDGAFADKGNNALFWCSSEMNATSAWTRGLAYNDALVYRLNVVYTAGNSIRCIKD